MRTFQFLNVFINTTFESMQMYRPIILSFHNHSCSRQAHTLCVHFDYFPRTSDIQYTRFTICMARQLWS